MINESSKIQGLIFVLLGLIPITASAVLVEYSGSRNMVIDGVERNVSLSITIDNVFHSRHSTVQYMYDNYPATPMIDEYYGYFDIHESELDFAGGVAVTGTSGQYNVWVTDLVIPGGGYDLSALRLETEDVLTGWSTRSRIQFLDEAGQPFDWSSWWGDAPTNELPPLLGVTRLDVWGAGEFSGYYYMDTDPMLLSPVPIPTAVWLFGSGILGLLSMLRRSSHHS